MRFTIFQDSRIGGRKVNQDRLAYSYSKDVLLMVIADGMGGHARGEIAADIAISTITNRFQTEAARGTLRRPREFLESAINSAHRAIVAYADEHEMLECPRTTVVACVVQAGRAVWAHSGDSRLYVFRDGRLGAVTQDHSRVQQLIDAGLLTIEAAAVHPDRNKIYNCLGGVMPPLVTISEDWPLKVGDRVILSTDGFWGPLNIDEMALRLHNTSVLDLIPQLLEDAERKAGSDSDNLSVIGMAWERQDGELDNPATVTMTMPMEGFTTSMLNTTQQMSILSKDDVTDEEIERAIAEIQNAIRKVSK
jgi:PPM family protein phosphatase